MVKLFDYIMQKSMEQNLDPEWKRFLKSSKPVIIYGAGRQARIAIDFCYMYQKKVFCLMATESRDRWALLPREEELPLYLVREFPDTLDKNSYDVLIALHSKWNKEISNILQNEKFPSAYQIKDWEQENFRIRETYYKSYFDYYGAKWEKDAAGETYLICPVSKETEFRMYYPKDRVFEANILGELGNIVMPSLFGDESVSCLGPYEFGENICLHQGDIVFDLGANVGLFSCVAAAKGCKVYAFEPEGIPVYEYLGKMSSLNEQIQTVPYAVGRKTGKSEFYYNNQLDTDFDLCQSSIHKELNPVYEKTEVNMITLDEFIEVNKIPRVDFIKSHIEYAEEEMLLGAMETLKKWTPVLSFYSQKLLGNDRYKKIEELILNANPNYKISYYKRRVYAYVPK